MRPIEPNDAQVAYWADYNPHSVVIGGPAEAPDVIPCPALITFPDGQPTPVVRVAFELDEIELAHLARGGTLWLSTWGGLPIHMMEVQPASVPETLG